MPSLSHLIDNPWLLSPWALGAVGLLVGMVLSVLARLLPRVLEMRWLGEAAVQLADADALRAHAGLDPAAAARLSQSADGVRQAIESQDISVSASCATCGHRFSWLERAPVVGWLLHRGRCGRCTAHRPARGPILEAATGVLFAAIAWRLGAQPATLLWCAFAAALVVLAAIDLETQLLPDAITLPLLWAGLAASALGATIPPTDALLGAVAGYLSLWSVYWAFRLATGQEGLGYGDFKLLAALGVWLGWQMVLPIIAIAALFGALAALAIRLAGRSVGGLRIPFGPFLVAGALLVLFAGPGQIIIAVVGRA